MSLLDDVSIVVTPNGYKAGTLYGVLPTATEGSELLSQSVDLTTDFVANAGGVIVDLDTFTSAGGTFDGLVSSTNTFEIGKRYKLIISGNTTSSGFGFYPASGSGFYGDGFGTHYFTATHEKLWVRQQTSGTTNITSFSIKEFTASDMDVTRETAATRVDENGLVNYAEVLGSEEVSCGDFACADPDAVWNRGTGWSISGGSAINSGSGANSWIYQSKSYSAGKTYKISADINLTSGSVRLGFNSVLADFITTTGNATYTYYLTLGSNQTFAGAKTGGSFAGSIDNISVKEVDLNNVPRIDYTGGGCPHILAEPQRTNSVTYSEDFSQWTVDGNASITSNAATSPAGTSNATKLKAGTSSGRQAIKLNNTTSGNIAAYVFAKKGEYSVIQLTDAVLGSAFANFDLENGLVGSTNTYSANIENYGNGWYKCSITYNSVGAINAFRLSIAESTTSARLVNFSGNGSNGLFIWGVQAEAGSYPTSYIPTSGSTVTRNQDQFSRDGIGSLINSTEGVLFTEMSALDNDLTTRMISLSDGGNTNRIHMFYHSVSNEIAVNYRVSGTTEASIGFVVSNITNFNKIAFKWKSGDFALWINGVEVGTDSNTTMLPADTLNKLAFEQGNGGNNLYAKVKQLQVYDTALTDMQLIQLTGTAGTDFYESYAEMASALTYTIQ